MNLVSALFSECSVGKSLHSMSKQELSVHSALDYTTYLKVESTQVFERFFVEKEHNINKKQNRTVDALSSSNGT